MGRFGTRLGFVTLLAGAAVSIAPAQTPGTATFTARTVSNGGDYDPRNVMAIWVADSTDTFVKTLKKQANNRQQYLRTWVAESSGNVVDAVTGATLSTHQTHTVVWDGTDVAGAVVADGEYRIRVEFTTDNVQGPVTPATHVRFTKGPAEDTVTPADLTYIKGMSVTWSPDAEPNILVAKKSMWKYNDTGTDLHATAWTSLAYDDAGWGSGAGKLGYSDTPATTLGYGPNEADKYPCYYFRHVFTADFVPLTLKVNVLRDDGVAVYLNGTEIVHDNLPAGPTAYSQYASDVVDAAAEQTYFTFTVEPTLLRAGDNILAAEVHQQSGSSSDLAFDLQLKAGAPAPTSRFARGDANASGSVEIADAVTVLDYLFGGAPPLACASAADANDDGRLDVSDAVSLLRHLFGGTGPLAEPFASCGTDPTADSLGCDAFAPCP